MRQPGRCGDAAGRRCRVRLAPRQRPVRPAAFAASYARFDADTTISLLCTWYMATYASRSRGSLQIKTSYRLTVGLQGMSCANRAGTWLYAGAAPRIDACFISEGLLLARLMLTLTPPCVTVS